MRGCEDRLPTYRLQTKGVYFEDADRPKKPVNVRNMANKEHTGQGCDVSAQSEVRLLLVFRLIPVYLPHAMFRHCCPNLIQRETCTRHRSRTQGNQEEPESRDEIILDDKVLPMKDEINFEGMIILCGKGAKKD